MGLLLGVFVLFFLVPVAWLFLAAGKTPDELVGDSPFSWAASRGSRPTGTRFWDSRMARSPAWMTNSVVYAVGALVLTLLVSVPAGYALAKMRSTEHRLLLVSTLVVMLMPATSLVLPDLLEINYLSPGQYPVVRDPPPYSFLPFRRLPGLYLLLDSHAERTARGRQDRWLRRVPRI